MTTPDITSWAFWKWLFTYIGLVTAAIIGTAQAWPIVEPWWIAHRQMVRETVHPVQMTVIELQRDRYEDQRTKFSGEADNWTITLQKETDPQTQKLIRDRIQQLRDASSRADDRLKALPPHN